ncbi:hypothetical protein GOP47_0029366 [Adiantum capillus-veneris]|nr:hypothetical protein GOP47_0029366 [Adiantum capillus-veneris]
MELQDRAEITGDGGTKKRQSANSFRLAMANILGLALAVPLLAVGAVLASKRNAYCITFIEKPLISLGLLLALVSIAGLCAAWTHLQWLHIAHMVSLFLLVLLLFCFAIFSVEITSNGSGHSPASYGSTPPPYAFKEYVLSDYPKWMRRKVERKHEWKEVTSCLQRNGFCGARLPYNGSDPFLFSQSPLSPIQSGCCKPPLACNFAYVDASHWITPSNPYASIDCATWDNNPMVLCYRCSSCKAGVIQATKDRWSKVGVTLFVVVIILVAFYTIIGSLAARHEK